VAAGVDLPRLFNTLTALLKLRPAPGGEPKLAYFVSPMLDIMPILRDHKSAAGTQDLQAAAGTYVPYFTVPAKKRWTLRLFLTSTSTAASTPRLQRTGGTAIDVGVSGTAAARLTMEGIILNPGDSIGRTTTGNALDSSQDAFLHYEEEDFVL